MLLQLFFMFYNGIIEITSREKKIADILKDSLEVDVMVDMVNTWIKLHSNAYLKANNRKKNLKTSGIDQKYND